MGAANRLRGPAPQGPSRRVPGFTLIELLVVIAIIALLLAILLPSLHMAREHGKAAVCVSKLAEMGKATAMYLTNEDQQVIRWYTIPAYSTWGAVGVRTPFVFAGMKAPQPAAGANGDSRYYPVNTFNGGPDPQNPGRTIDVRALNKLIAPEARDDDVVELYIDPGDRSYSTSIIGSSTPLFPSEQDSESWKRNGSSYNLNSRWLQGYYGIGNSWPGNFPVMFSRIARHMIGGSAADFIVWVELGFYSQTYNAGPDLTLSQARPQGTGWHQAFSKWSVAYADGHAEHRYFDTRLTRGPGWTIWQPGLVYP